MSLVLRTEPERSSRISNIKLRKSLVEDMVALSGDNSQALFSLYNAFREMESISDTASKADKERRPVLLSLDEMPEWFRRESNQGILHGYRPISGSAYASFCS